MTTYLKNRLTIFKKPAFTLFFIAAILGTLANGFVYISNTWLVVSLNHSLSAVLWSFLVFWGTGDIPSARDIIPWKPCQSSGCGRYLKSLPIYFGWKWVIIAHFWWQHDLTKTNINTSRFRNKRSIRRPTILTWWAKSVLFPEWYRGKNSKFNSQSDSPMRFHCSAWLF